MTKSEFRMLKFPEISQHQKNRVNHFRGVDRNWYHACGNILVFVTNIYAHTDLRRGRVCGPPLEVSTQSSAPLCYKRRRFILQPQITEYYIPTTRVPDGPRPATLSTEATPTGHIQHAFLLQKFPRFIRIVIVDTAVEFKIFTSNLLGYGPPSTTTLFPLSFTLLMTDTIYYCTHRLLKLNRKLIKGQPENFFIAFEVV